MYSVFLLTDAREAGKKKFGILEWTPACPAKLGRLPSPLRANLEAAATVAWSGITTACGTPTSGRFVSKLRSG
jgi:hypothetical protein